MRLIVALDRFLQFCQRAHAGFVRQLLLAFPARQQKVAFPSRRVGLDITRHLASLIWGDHRAPFVEISGVSTIRPRPNPPTKTACVH